MNSFEGKIDAIELALLNAKGVDHRTELLQELHILRRALKDVPMAPFQDIHDNPDALLHVSLTVAPRPIDAGFVICPSCQSEIDIFHGKRPSGETVRLESHLSDARFTCRTCYEPVETKSFVLDVHKKERNGGDPS